MEAQTWDVESADGKKLLSGMDRATALLQARSIANSTGTAVYLVTYDPEDDSALAVEVSPVRQEHWPWRD